MPEEEKHEDHMEHLIHEIHEIQHGPGFKGFIIFNAHGAMIRYEGFSHKEAWILTNRYNHCQSSMKQLMGPEDGVVDNVRLKCASYELICTQRGEFTFMVKQTFEKNPILDCHTGRVAEEN